MKLTVLPDPNDLKNYDPEDVEELFPGDQFSNIVYYKGKGTRLP